VATRHDGIDGQGKWLAQVLRGWMAYYAVPKSGSAISALQSSRTVDPKRSTAWSQRTTRSRHVGPQPMPQCLAQRDNAWPFAFYNSKRADCALGSLTGDPKCSSPR
jgi:hypothetical protein